jgi:hypothetical protein
MFGSDRLPDPSSSIAGAIKLLSVAILLAIAIVIDGSGITIVKFYKRFNCVEVYSKVMVKLMG